MTMSRPNVKRRDTLAHRAHSLSIRATFLEPHPHLPDSHLGQEALSNGPFQSGYQWANPLAFLTVSACFQKLRETESERKMWQFLNSVGH